MMKLSTIASLLLIGSAASQTTCPTELTQSVVLTDTLTMYYDVVDNVLCARMESLNEGWLGFGISPGGKQSLPTKACPL